MSSDYFEAIAARLLDCKHDGVTISRYRITWREFESLSAGVRDNDMLGVYSPLRSERGYAGAWLLEWSDGTLSRGNLDGASLANLDELLEAAAQARQSDEDAAIFLGETAIDRVPLASPDVGRLFEQDPGPLAELVGTLLDHGGTLGAKNTSAGASAGRGRRGVMTSEGLQLQDPYTTFSFYSYLDGEIGDGYGSRTLIGPEEALSRLATHDALYRASRTEQPWSEQRETTLILHPHAVESFLDHYVLSNLGGSSIVHGQSRWTQEEFASNSEVFRQDLTLRVEPNLPLHYGSYNFSGEGVPARPMAYIQSGRLTEPILNLKYAKKWNREPTTAPRGDSLRLDLVKEQAWEEFLPQAEDAVLVMNVLGMHTQDSVRGDYSLAVPTALRISDGKLSAKTRAVLGGNFFEVLCAEDLTAIRFPHQELVGLAFRATVYPDKG